MENGPETIQLEHLLSISPPGQAFFGCCAHLKGPGDPQTLSSQEAWVLFDLSFHPLSSNPVNCLIQAWGGEVCWGRVWWMLV